MSDLMVKAEGLGKRYALGVGGDARYASLRDVVTDRVGDLAGRALGGRRTAPVRPDRTFWALREIDFEIRRGEVVGVIGRNGAGKSTLLKILSRITEPTEGRVTMRGRVASLLEIGAGFHPELTGRENIYLNGAILGMSRAEIRAKFDEIVAFAETERFLETPVKRYSSGMYVRLAFAVAAHLEAEILIVDEVLAVGDAEFQARCLGKLGEVASDGRTVLFVSHNLATVERLCGSALLLDEGLIAARGPVAKVARRYLEGSTVARLQGAVYKTLNVGTSVRVDDFGFQAEGRDTNHIRSGEACEFRISYSRIGTEPLRRPPSFSILIYLNGQKVANLWTDYAAGRPPLPEGGAVRCVLPRWPFREGAVRVDLYVHVGPVTQDWFEGALALISSDGPFYGAGPLTGPDQGLLFLEHDWVEQCA